MLLVRVSSLRIQGCLAAPPRSTRAFSTQWEIENSISKSKARKAARDSQYLACPGCAQARLSTNAWLNHVRQCCPDLLRDEQEWQAALQQPVESTQLRRLMKEATRLQMAAEWQSLQLAFAQKDQSGHALRPRPAEFAPALGVPTARAERLLKSAIKATPMPADPEPVDILFEDNVLVAVNKPAKVRATPIHRHVGQSMVNRLIGHLGKPPHVLHRLDMDTTGIMLFAKDPRVVSAMHEQFRSRTISKTYAAICLGAPSATVVKQPSCVENIGVTPSREWEVDAPLARHPSIATASWVSSTGKSAQTRMIVRAEDCSTQWQGTKVGEAWCQPDTQCMNGACLLECKPVTGRTHQIRLHCATSGHPIIGDALYGVLSPIMPRHALHAWKLTFQHPVTSQAVHITAPLPTDMKQLAVSCCLQIAADLENEESP